MTEEVDQYDHFLSAGDRVILTERGYKRMSYNDVLIKAVTYRVVAVIDNNRFKIRLITR